MNVDIKIEASKIADEIINGTVEQACDDYKYLLGNFRFLTSSVLDKSLLNNLGTNLAKFVRKNPQNFLEFCTTIWYDSESEDRSPLGTIMAALENFIPEEVIHNAIEMCRVSTGIEDVDSIVVGFEPVIVRNPENYFDILEKHINDDNIWVKRLVIITVGHIMYRHKTADITNKCLEMIRPEIKNENEAIKKVTSWIIGSYGVRADQRTVADYIQSFEKSNNPVVVWTFSDAIRRSKISLQEDVCASLIDVFENWSNSKNSDVQKCARTALRALAAN